MTRLLLFTLIFLPMCLFAQPQALDTGMVIDEYLNAKGNAIRLVYEKHNDQLLYITGEGNIYGLSEDQNGNVSETHLFTPLDHEITFVQGMAIRDSVMVVCGNVDAFEPTTVGKVALAHLNSSGNWVWRNLVTTVPYESANNFDHLFSGIVISEDGNDVIWCSGARGTHGEIQTYDGRYPGLRGLPITNILLSVPINSPSITLQNDSAWLANNNYVYARGTRNFFDLEYTSDGKLYALENSGDRDDPEEMNEIIKGEHYGYPWTMGGNENPMQYVPFDPENDLLINKYCKAMQRGYFYEDADFPQAPNISFKEPIKNYGPDADYYRDPVSGAVKKASDTGGFITTFSSHRSPLGLAFENNNLSDPRLKGMGFMLSWTPGGDANGWRYAGNDTITGTFVDESEDLVMISPRNGSFNEINSYRLARNFNTPIDLAIARNKMYILEYDYTSPKIYSITFSGTTSIKERHLEDAFSVYPNPTDNILNLEYDDKLSFKQMLIIDGLGGKMHEYYKATSKLDLGGLKAGIYCLQITDTHGNTGTKRIMIK